MGSQLSLLVVLLSMASIMGGAVEETKSPWLDRIQRRPPGCRFRPGICRDPLEPFRRLLCCRNHCIDVGSDPNNCGFCGVRCLFRWSCCSGFCVDTMMNPFHCGGCDIRCPVGSLCIYGLCGYD